MRLHARFLSPISESTSQTRTQSISSPPPSSIVFLAASLFPGRRCRCNWAARQLALACVCERQLSIRARLLKYTAQSQPCRLPAASCKKLEYSAWRSWGGCGSRKSNLPLPLTHHRVPRVWQVRDRRQLPPEEQSDHAPDQHRPQQRGSRHHEERKTLALLD